MKNPFIWAFCAGVVLAAYVATSESATELRRAVMTDTNGVVTSHGDLALTNGISLTNTAAAAATALQPAGTNNYVGAYASAAKYLVGADGTSPVLSNSGTNWFVDRADTFRAALGLGTAALSSNEAYAAAAHASATNNPHNVTAAQIGALTAESDTLATVSARGATTSNRITVAGITSSAANTNTAASYWRSAGGETKASVDNETGAGTFATASIRGKDSSSLYDSLACSTNSAFGYIKDYSYKFLKPVCWGIGSETNVVVYTDKNMAVTNGTHYGALALSTTNGWGGVVSQSGSFTAGDSTTTYPNSGGPTVSNWTNFFAVGTTVYWAEIRGSFYTFNGATLSPISHTNAIAVAGSASYDAFSYGTPLLRITGTDHYSGHARISIFTGDGNVEALDFTGRANGVHRALSTPDGYSWTGSQNNRVACGGNRYSGNCVGADTNAFFLFRGYASAASTNVTSSQVWQGKWSFDYAPSHSATVIPHD